MKQIIHAVTLVVRDYDEAIDFYTKKLSFVVIKDEKVDENKRWVLLSPPGSTESRILLAKASSPEQQKCIGNQTGGRVFLFLNTDDFWRDYHKMLSYGIIFLEKPREEKYGTVAVFTDLYGNKWDLLKLL